jgi:hypothetical protein
MMRLVTTVTAAYFDGTVPWGSFAMDVPVGVGESVDSKSLDLFVTNGCE